MRPSRAASKVGKQVKEVHSRAQLLAKVVGLARAGSSWLQQDRTHQLVCWWNPGYIV
jgi:hypothetical protein